MTLITEEEGSIQGIHIPARDFARLIWSFIPDYMKDSSVPFPEEVRLEFSWAETIRSGFKNMLRPFLPRLLFMMYGEHAPKIARHQDSLPFIWRMLTDFVTIQAIQKPVRFYLKREHGTENGFRLVAVAPIPVRQETDAAANAAAEAGRK